MRVLRCNRHLLRDRTHACPTYGGWPIEEPTQLSPPNAYYKVRTRSITELLRSRPTPGAPDPDEELDLLYF